MAFRITTWNINSVRLRINLVTRFLKEHAPDVLCLQETKCPNDQFPLGEFRKLGYGSIAIKGQKGYNGVAIISRHPFASLDAVNYCDKEDCRHISVVIGANAKGAAGLTIHNFYVPAGGDLADPELNVKFAHKLAFLAQLEALAAAGRERRRAEIIVGDLNVAPLEHDVWSHKQLLDVVSHTPIETETLTRIRLSGGWKDSVRDLEPEPKKVYTWWSYRAQDWAASNRGRRLDHVWHSDDLSPTLQSYEILSDARGWERPSDHVPLTVAYDL